MSVWYVQYYIYITTKIIPCSCFSVFLLLLTHSQFLAVGLTLLLFDHDWVFAVHVHPACLLLTLTLWRLCWNDILCSPSVWQWTALHGIRTEEFSQNILLSCDQVVKYSCCQVFPAQQVLVKTPDWRQKAVETSRGQLWLQCGAALKGRCRSF